VQGAAVNAVDALSETQVAVGTVEELTEAVLADKVPKQIRLDTANHRVSNDIVNTPSGRERVRSLLLTGAMPAASTGVESRLHIPYAGTQQVFFIRPTKIPSNPPETVFAGQEIVLSVIDTSDDPAVVRKLLLKQEQNLLVWVEMVNEDIGRLERQIRAVVADRVVQRRAVVEKRDRLLAGLDIPIRHVESERALEIPVQRTIAALELAAVPPRGESQQWRLADGVYEQVIRTITSFAHALERRPPSACNWSSTKRRCGTGCCSCSMQTTRHQVAANCSSVARRSTVRARPTSWSGIRA
jgi:hypothetical protein